MIGRARQVVGGLFLCARRVSLCRERGRPRHGEALLLGREMRFLNLLTIKFGYIV
jgi:hypothetical protein